MKKTRHPRSAVSIRWLREEWLATLSKTPKATMLRETSRALAQLSYENERLRERAAENEQQISDLLEAMQRVRVSQEKMKEGLVKLANAVRMGLTEEIVESSMEQDKDGMFLVDGTPHLHECDRVQRPLLRETRCTCGSEGPRECGARSN